MTWSVQRSTAPSGLNALHFTDRKSGWAVGDSGVILGTIDGGTHWNSQQSGTTEPLATVQFVDAKTGWAAGGHGTVLATRDGGVTWTPQVTDTRLPFVSLRFESAKRGIAVAANLAVYRTDNGGVTWEAPRPGKSPAPWYYLSLVAAAALAAPAFRKIAPPAAPKDSVENMLVSDRPLQPGDRDHLRIGDIAAGLSRFLRNEMTEPPLTIAVTGPWGSGKSSLMNLLAGDLVRAGFPTVWFNAWHHQKDEHLLGALVDTVRLQAVPPIWKPGGMRFRARLLYGRWKRRMPIVVAILVAFSLSLGYYRAHPDQWDGASQVAGEFFKKAITSPIESAWDVIQAPFTLAMTLFGLLVNLGNETQAHVNPGSVLGLILTSGAALLLATAKGFRAFALKGSGITDMLARLLGARDPETAAGAHNRFAEEFRDVTTALRPRKLLVNIDDLDRCGPDKVAEVLEAVNFLVSSGDCYVVLGMETQWVRACIGLAYKKVAAEVAGADGSGAESARGKRKEFARHYLEKLINIEVPIPPPTDMASQQLVAPRRDEVEARHRRDEERVVRVAAVLPRVVAWSLALLCVAGAYFVGGTVLKPLRLAPPPVVEAAPAPAKPPAPIDADKQASLPRQGSAENQAQHPRDPRPSFVSGVSPRRQVWPVWAVMAGIALLVAGVWRSSISGEMIVKDSLKFSEALLVWQPLVSLKGNTPRALKRFLNRVRYHAMSQRGDSGVATAMERIVERILPGAARVSKGAEETPSAAVREELLVAWSALSYVYEDDGGAPSIFAAMDRLSKETRLSPFQTKAVQDWAQAHLNELLSHAESLATAPKGARFIDEQTALGGTDSGAPAPSARATSSPPAGRPRSSA
ncbi:MAG: hypothetical protein HY049_08220 [Acidobacteria bacterium]|nr:hypothetical protein [Acidobacteriota bacterium]